MADISRSKKVCCLWDESARPKFNIHGYHVVQAIRTFASKFGVVNALSLYLDDSESCCLSPAFTSELQCSGVRIVNTASNGRQGAASKMLLADMFIHAVANMSTTLLVVSADPDLGYAISMLRLRGHELFLVCPRGSDANLIRLSEGNTLDGDILQTSPYFATPILHPSPSPGRAHEASVIESSRENTVFFTAPSGSLVDPAGTSAGASDPAGEGHTPICTSVRSLTVVGETDSIGHLAGGRLHAEPRGRGNASIYIEPSPKKMKMKMKMKMKKGRKLKDKSTQTENVTLTSSKDALNGETNIIRLAQAHASGTASPTSKVMGNHTSPIDGANDSRSGNYSSVTTDLAVVPALANSEGTSPSLNSQSPLSPILCSEPHNSKAAAFSVNVEKPFRVPAGVPSHFQPLIRVMRELIAAGRHVFLPDELFAPVLAIHPRILHDANVAAKEKPWRRYLWAAEMAAVVIVTWSEGRKTYTLSPAYCSDLRSAFGDLPTFDGQDTSQRDGKVTPRAPENIPTYDFRSDKHAAWTGEEPPFRNAMATPAQLASSIATATPSDPAILSAGGEQPTMGPSARAPIFINEINGAVQKRCTATSQASPRPKEQPSTLHPELQNPDHETRFEQATQDLVSHNSTVDDLVSIPTQLRTSPDAVQKPCSDDGVRYGTTAVQDLPIELVPQTHSILVKDSEISPVLVDDKTSSRFLEATRPSPRPTQLDDVAPFPSPSTAEGVTNFPTPSTVPAYFHPLMGVLREKIAGGADTVSQSELAVPLLDREPRILHQAGVIKSKKPWETYVEAAEAAGVIAVRSGVAEPTVSLTARYRSSLPPSAIPATAHPFPGEHAHRRPGNEISLEVEPAPLAETGHNEPATLGVDDTPPSPTALSTEDVMAIALLGCVDAVETCPATQKWCVLFKKLPDRQVYPEYYSSIQHPISLAEVRCNIAAGLYRNVEAFEADMKLLFDNGRAWYRKGSWMATVAEEMEMTFKSYVDEVFGTPQLWTSTVPESASTGARPLSNVLGDATVDNGQADIISLSQTPPSLSSSKVPEIIVDASFTGIGFVYEDRWCSWKLKDAWRSPERHITWAELVAIELGLRTAIAMGAKPGALRVRSDSQPAIYVLKTQTTRNPHEKVVLDQIIWLQRANMIQLVPVWIWTKANPADPISRQRYPPMAQRVENEPWIPPHLMDYVEAYYPTTMHAPANEPAEVNTSHFEPDTGLGHQGPGPHTLGGICMPPASAAGERHPQTSTFSSTLFNGGATVKAQVLSPTNTGSSCVGTPETPNPLSRSTEVWEDASLKDDGPADFVSLTATTTLSETLPEGKSLGGQLPVVGSAAFAHVSPTFSAPTANCSTSAPHTTPVPATNPSFAIPNTAPFVPPAVPAASASESGPSTAVIPPIFQPLVQHFRSLRGQGKHIVNISSLDTPLRRLDPSIFVKAGTAQRSKPLKRYVANAVNMGILQDQKNANYALRPEYW